MLQVQMMIKECYENVKERYPNWAKISDHPYRLLTIGVSGSEKTNVVFNLTNQQPDIDKIYLHALDPYKAKYKFLINKRVSTGIKNCSNSKAFI